MSGRCFLAAMVALSALVAADSARADEPLPLVLQKGDHIALVGNTLPDRMQHDGWLETLIQARFPDHELVIRNLGFSGDELTTRIRSADFGSPDDWLRKVEADVVIAFFGYNESFAGEPGLDRFKADLRQFITHTLAQKYHGERATQLVLCSPIAHENLHKPYLPDGRANNTRLALYTQAMAEVAREKQVAFIDLFHPTLEAESAAGHPPLTENGIHPTPDGSLVIARIFEKAAFAGPPVGDLPYLASIRQAVLDKNFHWFERYRTTDGYSIYGGRADLKFTNGQSNRDVMSREMEVLDVLTANRDQRIWAAAARRPFQLDDSNTPPFVPVITNKPGANPDGTHVFLEADREAIAHMTIHPELQVNLFADEKQFPDLVEPVQIAFDPRGRLFVAVWPSYPHWKPKEPLDDKLLILSDTDGDGRADRSKVFAGGLHNPTGFEFWGKGVIVAMAPDLLYLEDTNGDDVADIRTRILSGIDSADTHHTANSFVLGPGGDLYFQEGTFHHSQIESPWAPTLRVANAGVYRFEPRTRKVSAFVSHPFANPHGHVIDRWGQGIVHDGTGAQPYHSTLFSGHIDYPAKHATPPRVYDQRTRPCPATELLVSAHFPESMQGNLLVGNVIGFQGILRYRLEDRGASFSAVEQEPIVSSDDPNFRPTDLEIAPDGSLYFTDWQNPIIGHMQHNLRDPNRDRDHGRVYRVTAKNRPLLTPPPVAGQPVAALLELLKSPEDRLRYRVRIALAGRETKEVMAALDAWLAALPADDPEHEHQVLEALWLHQSHDVVDGALLDRVLKSSDWHARAAAVRVLCYWRDRVPDALARLRSAAADPYPRVRLEAIRAASFFDQPEAIEVVAIESSQPSDEYLDYTRKETLRVLDPIWKPALESGRDLVMTTPEGARYVLANMKLETLLKRPRDEAVCEELLVRPGVRDEARSAALADLSRLRQAAPARVLLDLLKSIDTRPQVETSALFDLIRQINAVSAAERAEQRAALESLARGASQPLIRQGAFAMLLNLDGTADRAWDLSNSSPSGPLDLASAVALVSDASLRASLFPRLVTLLRDSAAGSPLRHAAMDALASIRGHEVETFKTLAALVNSDADAAPAIRALVRLPRSSWPAPEAPALLDTLTARVAALPTADRTSQNALDALDLADALTTLLPADQAAAARARLRELGVRVIKVGTLFERMSYDKDTLAVAAGKPVEFVFENSDLMPHNFVVTRPGALEEVGMQAEATAQDPAAPGRNYVPVNDKILLASRLLQPRQSQRLPFTAPSEPGVYPFVCTYPGHWRRMYGALYVVPDLDAYLADPAAYLAANPLPVKDTLLAERRPRTEWTVADLAPAVRELKGGRAFGNGRQMFQVATCVACHRVAETGNAFGPDLAQLDPKLSPEEILKNVVEPSAVINEKYRSHVLELDNGQVVTGLIVEETPEVVKLVENPLASTEPRSIDKRDIVDRQAAPTSLMPKGLLDPLNREEILDLIAFLIARGDPKHPIYQESAGGHDHSAGAHTH